MSHAYDNRRNWRRRALEAEDCLVVALGQMRTVHAALGYAPGEPKGRSFSEAVMDKLEELRREIAQAAE